MLTRLREKPHHIKQIVSLVITVIIFSAIVFVWWSSRDARSREVEVQAKTVTPIDGLTSMFDGLVSGFKKKVSESTLSGTESFSTSTATDSFDLGGIVVIDSSATTTKTASTSNSIVNTGSN
ncbi:MAG: hypothetical protein WC791_03415 [Candidatus Paceibacterota bacterium]|jgi:hypothetical protein